MDDDDVGDLMASWRRYPPPHLALHRLERLFMTAHHLQFQKETASEAPPVEPPSPEQLQRALDAFNARFAGRVPRV